MQSCNIDRVCQVLAAAISNGRGEVVPPSLPPIWLNEAVVWYQPQMETIAWVPKAPSAKPEEYILLT